MKKDFFSSKFFGGDENFR